MKSLIGKIENNRIERKNQKVKSSPKHESERNSGERNYFPSNLTSNDNKIRKSTENLLNPNLNKKRKFKRRRAKAVSEQYTFQKQKDNKL